MVNVNSKTTILPQINTSSKPNFNFGRSTLSNISTANLKSIGDSFTTDNLKNIVNGTTNFLIDKTGDAVNFVKNIATSDEVKNNIPQTVKSNIQLVKNSIQNNPVSYAGGALLASVALGYYLGQKKNKQDDEA